MTTPAAPAVVTAPPPPPDIDPAAIAAAIDPQSIAQYVAPPQPPMVEMSDQFFGSISEVASMTAIVIIAFLIMRLLSAFMLHRSINKSIDAKSDHAAALIDKVNKPLDLTARSANNGPGDDRNGLVLIAIGLAMAGFGLVQGDTETIRIAVGAALFPLFVGIALLVRRALLKRELAGEQAAGQG